MPRNVASTASASFPGITRGMMKLTVSAAQSVTRNRPPRRARYLIRSLRGVQVRQDHFVVGERVRRGLRIGVLLGHPATDLRRVVLVPVHAFGRRDQRDLIDHHLLDLVNDLLLL